MNIKNFPIKFTLMASGDYFTKDRKTELERYGFRFKYKPDKIGYPFEWKLKKKHNPTLEFYTLDQFSEWSKNCTERIGFNMQMDIMLFMGESHPMPYNRMLLGFPIIECDN